MVNHLMFATYSIIELKVKFLHISTHLINLGFESFFAIKKVSAAWLVWTVTVVPKKYDLNFSNA